MPGHRLRQALLCFAALGILSALTLSGKIRLATLVFLAGLALLSYVSYLRHRLEASEENPHKSDHEPADHS